MLPVIVVVFDGVVSAVGHDDDVTIMVGAAVVLFEDGDEGTVFDDSIHTFTIDMEKYDVGSIIYLCKHGNVSLIILLCLFQFWVLPLRIGHQLQHLRYLFQIEEDNDTFL